MHAVVMSPVRLLLVLAIAFAAGCGARHGGPVIDTGAKPVGVGGTIAGIVRGSGTDASLAGRKVTAINEATGARFDISTASNGGYTVQVPAGTYRLEIELRPGETIQTRPQPTQVNVGDIDEGKDFVLTAGR
jgi:hypothetical protein